MREAWARRVKWYQAQHILNYLPRHKGDELPQLGAGKALRKGKEPDPPIQIQLLDQLRLLPRRKPRDHPELGKCVVCSAHPNLHPHKCLGTHFYHTEVNFGSVTVGSHYK